MRSITILQDRHASRAHGEYFVDYMVPFWEKMGFRTVRCYDPEALAPTDVLIMHIDQTVVPDDYMEAARGAAIVLNGAATDTSRLRYSANIVSFDDDYDGPVIVKSVRNYGGLPELTARVRSGDPSAARSAAETAWHKREFIDPRAYPIYPCKKDVPYGAWRNAHLVVEKFLPEIENDLYYLRYWYFLGERSFTGRFGARQPIVKFDRAVTKYEAIPVPDALRAARRTLGIDYGRIDFAIHEEQVVLFDVNRTPAGNDELYDFATQMEEVSNGILDFVDSA